MKEELAASKKEEIMVPEETGHEGLEHVRPQDQVLPRIGFCQSLSPERDRTHSKFIQGLQEGQLFNNLTQQVYGESVEILPIIYKPAPRILWRKRDEGSGMLCISQNGVDGGTIAPTCDACPNSKHTTDATGKYVPPKCTEYMTFACLTVKDHDLVTIALKSTGLKKGKAFVTRANMLNVPFFHQVWKMEAIPEKNDKGQPYFAPKFTLIRSKDKVTAEEKALGRETYNAIKGTTFVKAENLQEDNLEPGEDRVF